MISSKVKYSPPCRSDNGKSIIARGKGICQNIENELIAASIESSPVPIQSSDSLPDGIQAQYVPKNRTIYVRNGMDRERDYGIVKQKRRTIMVRRKYYA